MDANYWTDETILKLRSLLLKKWESLGEDDGAFCKWLIEQKIFLPGDDRAEESAEATGVAVCLGRYPRRRPAGLSGRRIVSQKRRCRCGPFRQETWLLVPEDFAKKALVLGLP